MEKLIDISVFSDTFTIETTNIHTFGMPIFNFEEFYKKHRTSYIYRNWVRVCKYLTNKEDKLDIYQEAMACLWVKISTGFVPQSYEAFFFSIFKGYVLNFCRNRNNHSTKFDDLAVHGYIPSKADEAYKFEKKTLVQQALEVLATKYPDHATLLILRYINDLDFEEIQKIFDAQFNTLLRKFSDILVCHCEQNERKISQRKRRNFERV